MARDIQIKIGATDAASSVFGKVAANAKKLGTGITSIGNSMRSAGQSTAAFGAKLAVAGGVVTGAFAGAVRTFSVFDDSMSAVSAKSGATGDSLARMRDLAKELGSSTKFSASEAASGMEFLAQAGFKTEEIMSAIGPALSLAAAGGVELNEAADIASNVAAGFGLSANEFQRVADVMARAATAANTDILMMGETFNQSAAIAKTAGQSIEETSAALGLLANSGIQASSAGTDIKNVLSKLSETGVQEKMEALGVTVRDSVTGEFRPMLDIMREFGQQTANMNGPDKLALSMDLFGKISGKSALILSDAGDAVDDMRLKMVDTSVTAETMATTMASGLGGVGTTIKSAFEGVQIAIGETFKDSLMVAGNAVASFLQGTTKLIAENKQIVIAVGVAGVAVTSFGVALVGLGGIAIATGAALTGLVTIAGFVAAAVSTVLSPVGLAVAAVGALGGAFVYAGVQSGAFTDALAGIKESLGDLLTIATTTFGGVSNAIKDGNWAGAADIAWAGVKAAFWTGLDGVYSAVSTVIPKIWDSFKSLFSRLVSAASAAISTIAKAIKNPFKAAGAIKGFFSSGALDFSSSDGGVAGYLKQQRIASREELAQLAAAVSTQTKSIESVVAGSAPKIAQTAADALVDQKPTVTFEADYKLKAGAVPSVPALPGIDAGQDSVKKSSHLMDLQAVEGRLMTRGRESNDSDKRTAEAKERKSQLDRIDANLKEMVSLGRQNVNQSPTFVGVIG